MPRCGCGSVCACQIIADPECVNLTITGDGSADTPYQLCMEAGGDIFFRVDDPAYGAVEGAGGNAAANTLAFNDAIADAAVLGGIVWVPAGLWRLNLGVLELDTATVSIWGPTSGGTILDFIGGTGAAIRVHADPFTVTQAASLRSLTIDGPTTASAKGVHIGDIIGFEFYDVVVRNFTGAGAVGIHMDNVDWFTERTSFNRTWVANCSTLVRFSVSGSGPNTTNSMGYTHIVGLQLNASAGQTFVDFEDNVNLYSCNPCQINGNADGNNTIGFDFNSSTAFWGSDQFAVTIEQTGATGGIPRRSNAAGPVVYGFGAFKFENSWAADAGNWHADAIWNVGKETVTTDHAQWLNGGSEAAFGGSANTATFVPALTDRVQSPLAVIGIAHGNSIASPYVVAYDAAGGGLLVYKRGAGAWPGTLLFRLGVDGTIHLINTVEPATPVGGAKLYSEGGALKAKGTSGTVTTVGPA